MITETVEYQRNKAKQIHDLIYSDGFRNVHDESCDLVTKENPFEWYCSCELNEILGLVGQK